MQESNPSTANIARINMFLHGVRSFQQAPALDSLRGHVLPRGVQTRRLRQFDRIVMNPTVFPPNLGFMTILRAAIPTIGFGFTLHPRNNGDYAWMQHVAKSLKPTGRAIVVMSQGILFRGQPEQTEEGGWSQAEGRRRISDTRGLHQVRSHRVRHRPTVEAFLWQWRPRLPRGLAKRKPADRKNKILLIWASRHYQANNPQNLLRRSDCLRILVPFRAFGDPEKCRPPHPRARKKILIADIDHERGCSTLPDIHTAYGPILASLPALAQELTERQEFAKKESPANNEGKKKVREDKRTQRR